VDQTGLVRFVIRIVTNYVTFIVRDGNGAESLGGGACWIRRPGFPVETSASALGFLL
jgi:hypothetical protein